MTEDAVGMNNLVPLRIADAAAGIRHVFVRNLILDAHIGAYDSEVGTTQPIRINIDLSVDEGAVGHDDQLDNVVCYNQIVADIRALVSAGHIHLVETLAERIADKALQDRRIRAARVRVEKMSAIVDAESVGVEIERHRKDL